MAGSSKSYVRLGLTLNGTGGVAPNLRQMLALADNVGGNLFSNASLRIQGQSTISQITAGLDRASAICSRLENGNSWLNSIGSGSNLNIAKFSKRNEFTAVESPPDAYLGAENEMYKPTSAGNFGAATVAYTAASGAIAGIGTLFTTGMPNAATGAISGSSVRLGDILDPWNLLSSHHNHE